ncbi:MAG TPA: carbon-nitrogen hydrolase family protein [Gammaproteobacteria bacterium]|nr:carbon-nitrogen hydrolase family protein [Gammaproteobacteria bacterium]
MVDFKIAAVQVASVRGDIDGNIATHAAAMTAAAGRGISLLVFPELSLTGYELDLAADLAITGTDRKLEPLRALARRHSMDIVVGAPLRDGAEKPKLGAIVIRSSGASEAYHKMHLGGDEPSYFVPGNEPLLLAVGGYKVGIAICADSSRATHPESYATSGAKIYAAGVFLTAEWYETDVPRLAKYAESYEMLTVMANHAASVGSYESVGKSAVWAPKGELLVQAVGTESALLIASSTNGTWQGEVVAL